MLILELIASQLSGKDVGHAMEDAGDMLFITGVEHTRQKTTVTGVSAPFGVPALRKLELNGSQEVKLFPDVRMASFTMGNYGTVKTPVESIEVQLPHGHYGSANLRKDQRNGWRVESFEGTKIGLTRN